MKKHAQKDTMTRTHTQVFSQKQTHGSQAGWDKACSSKGCGIYNTFVSLENQTLNSCCHVFNITGDLLSIKSITKVLEIRSLSYELNLKKKEVKILNKI